MSAHEFLIPIHDLDAGGKAFSFPVRAAWLRGALEDTEIETTSQDGTLELRASRSGQDIVLHGRLRADLTVPCARCLQPVPLKVDKDLSALAVPHGAVRGSGGEQDDYEFSQDEADVLAYEGDNVVLDDLVRDELVLEEPMIPLCSEDCPGIDARPAPGDDSADRGGPGDKGERGVDPRLAPLLRLKLAGSSKTPSKEPSQKSSEGASPKASKKNPQKDSQ